MDRLSHLQTMFPTLDGDVVAMVLSRNKDSVETAVETLLEMSSLAEYSKSSTYSTVSAVHSTTSSKTPFPGWANSQAFPPLPGHVGQAPIPHSTQQLYRPQPSLIPRSIPDPSGFHPPSYQQPGRQYPLPPVNYPSLGSSNTTPLQNGGVALNGSEMPAPSRSVSAPHIGGNVPQWRPPNLSIRNMNGSHVMGSGGHVSSTASTEHAQIRPPQTAIHRPPGIPRLQNRHLEPRGRLDTHGQQRQQGSKGQERSTGSEQKPSSSGGGSEKKLVIIRGLPGSGKSTLARNLRGQNGVICSTDDFFVVDGKYVFDSSLLSENHEKNRAKARKSMASGKSPVIIDNTNSNAWEMKPYVTLAIKYGYNVEIVEPDTPWRFKVAELAKRNKHGVSKQSIERMLERYEHRMSLERILVSERPEVTIPPDRTSSSESNKENRPGNKHPKEHQKENNKTKPAEKAPKEGQTSAGNLHAQGGHVTRRKSLSPKPIKRSETHQQSKQTKVVVNSNHSGEGKPLDSVEKSKANRKTRDDSKVTDRVSQPFSPPSRKAENRPQTEGAVSSGEKISLSSVPSVAQIEASLSAQEWDSQEEGGFSSDEDLSSLNRQRTQHSPARTIAQGNVVACSSSNDGNSRAKSPHAGIHLDTFSVQPGGRGVAMASEGTTLIAQSWEAVRKDGANFVAMFPQLRVSLGPGTSPSPIGHRERVNNELMMKNEKLTDNTMASETTGSGGRMVGMTGSRGMALNRETMKGRQVTGNEGPKGSGEMTGSQNQTERRNSRETTESGDVTGSEEMTGGGEMTRSSEVTKSSGTDTGASTDSTDIMNTTRKGGRRSERSLSMLSAAFDSCQGWQEKYLAEAARDEATLLRSQDTSLDVALLGNLLPKYTPWVAVSASSEAPGASVVRKSRLISGLNMKNECSPESESIQMNSLMATFQQRIGSVCDSTPALLSETVSTGGNVTGGALLESKASLAPDSNTDHKGGVDSQSNACAIVSGKISEGPQAVENGQVVDNVTNSNRETVPEDARSPLVDNSGGRIYEEGGPLKKSPLSPVEEANTSNSLDAFLTSDESGSSSSDESSVSRDSLERELSDAAHEMDVFPSAFPGQINGDPFDPSSHSSLFPPPSMTDESYVNLEDSLYSSDDEDDGDDGGGGGSDAGIAFTVPVRGGEIPFKAGSGATRADETERGESVSDLEEGAECRGTSASTKSSVDHEGGDSDSKDEQDFTFLMECFPDLEPSYLRQLFTRCDGNLHDTLSIALVSMITPVPLDKDLEDSPSKDEAKSTVKVLSSHSHPALFERECFDDERIAKTLQEQFDEGEEDPCEVAGSNESSPSSRSKEPRGEGLVVGDDALVLTLSESFAKQLQALLWAVGQHLPYSGTVKAEDLKVPLSKKLARSIHQKWIQTLKTKYQLGGESPSLSRAKSKHRVASAPQLHHTSDKQPSKKGRCPVQNLSSIMDEQLAQELGNEEMVMLVKSSLTTSQQIQLKQLYKRFPGAHKSVVCNVLVKTKYNFTEATRQLKEMFPPRSSHAKPLLQPTASTGGQKEKDHTQWQPPLTYDDLRAEAALQANLRAECFQKAARAHSQKKMDLAQYYAQKGHLHTEKMKEANTRAAKLTVKQHNSDSPGRRIDLHGLHVTEAIAILREKLSTTRKGGPLCVVTGRGVHSEGQVARIKPAVVKFLKTSGYKYEEVNAGMLKVHLK